MASAKSTSTTRRATSRRGSGKDADAEISPARWAGVALVIAALVGAIALAALSPSDPAGPGTQGGIAVVEATPVPAATVLDTRVPTVVPSITNPVSDSLTPEIDIEVDVEVPEEVLGRKFLTLVVLRDGQVIGEKSRPKTGGLVTVGGVRLLEGHNEITAALQGPGGLLGPQSEPVVVNVDRDAPRLELTAPTNKHKTFESTVEVKGTSEVGSSVAITNEVEGYAPGAFVIGPAGSFEVPVPLKKGRNVIVASSKDQAGQTQTRTLVVTRKDGKPFVEVKVPKQVKRSALPRKVKLVVTVVDSEGDPMPGATVSYSIGGDNRTAETFVDETAENGRSTWSPEVKGGSSPVLVGVEVRSPYGGSRSLSREIALK
jgi:hypothetical protein